MITKIEIKKKPTFIIITKFLGDEYQYWMNNLDTVNNFCDVGFWRIKYK